jgi:hypothetical protein
MMRNMSETIIADFKAMSAPTRIGLGVYLALIMLTGLVSLALAFSSPRPFTPLVEFEESHVPPDKQEYCVGETVKFSFHWKAVHVPATVRLHYNVYDQLNEKFVVVNKSSDARVFILTETKEAEQNAGFPIPKLSPGSYELRGAVESNYAESSVITVPFKISDTCP